MKRLLFIVFAIFFVAECFSQDKHYATIHTYREDVKNARDMNIEPITQNEREFFNDFCKKIANPFLYIVKAEIGETRRLLIYAKKLPKAVDYDAVSYYMMTCGLSIGLKISCCTIVDVSTVEVKSSNSMEGEILGSSFWNSWEIKK